MVISPLEPSRRNWRKKDTRKTKRSLLEVSSLAVSAGNGSISAKQGYKWLPLIVLSNLELWLADLVARGRRLEERWRRSCREEEEEEKKERRKAVSREF
ncbi:hypothetical protein JCGZ_08392 [Jatropha curcas]|uniref:Uncharacterized protein n=1 Tax=Jatropha curcas TaxID=180498 RepID=A0A067KIP9_JATCU|nr:hypothetical protein JCGZ_08392 [Jatropha curcas]